MIMIHLKFENMRNRLLILLMLVSSITFGQVTLDSARNYVNSNIVTNGTKAITGAKLNTSLNNIITAVGLQRKVDSIYYNGGADSLVYKINTKRYALPVVSGGGGVSESLSDLLAATDSNVIDNGNNKQEWKWNSLGSGIGLKISTASSVATGNNQVLMELRKTVGTSGASNGSVLLNLINEDGNASSVTKAAHFEAKSFAATFGKTGVDAGYGNIGIFGNSKVSFYQNSTESVFFRKNYNLNYFEMVASTAGYIFQVGTTNQIRFATSTGVPFIGYYHNNSSKQTQLFNAVSDGSFYPSGTHASLIENENGVLKFSANSGLTQNVVFTPVWQLALHGANNNVGIGTTTPNASAKLDVSSTTQGFAPPEMTATQASAISTTSRKLIIYVTSTNGTFTSAGLWMWTGATWKLILAQ